MTSRPRKEIIADNIRLLRVRAGMSQQTLAEMLGIDRATVVKYENAKREPGETRLQAIAVILDVEVGYLYTEQLEVNGATA